jgi:hypothetical protein
MAGPHKVSAEHSTAGPRRAAWCRWLPIGVIALGLVLVFVFDIDDFASAEHLREHHQRLTEFVAAHAVQATLIYLALYIVFVALSLPGAIWLTVAAGFLFGAVMGSILSVLAATVGATCCSWPPRPRSATICAPTPDRGWRRWSAASPTISGATC